MCRILLLHRTQNFGMLGSFYRDKTHAAIVVWNPDRRLTNTDNCQGLRGFVSRSEI